MLLDPKWFVRVRSGLGYEVPGRTEFTSPYLIQANDADEAEEKILNTWTITGERGFLD
jgi:hypothetical protein